MTIVMKQVAIIATIPETMIFFNLTNIKNKLWKNNIFIQWRNFFNSLSSVFKYISYFFRLVFTHIDRRSNFNTVGILYKYYFYTCLTQNKIIF